MRKRTIRRAAGACALALGLSFAGGACAQDPGDYAATVVVEPGFVRADLKTGVTHLLALKFETGFGCDRAPQSGRFTGRFNPWCVSEGIAIAGGASMPPELGYAMSHRITGNEGCGLSLCPGTAEWAWWTIWATDHYGQPICYHVAQTLLALSPAFGAPATQHGVTYPEGDCHG